MADVKTEWLFAMDLILGSDARQDVGTTPSGARIIVPVASIMGSATLCFSRWTQRRGCQLH